MTEPLAYSVERVFEVSVERLWTAWTDASELAVWYCPVGLSVTPGSTVSDAITGGRWSAAVNVPDGGAAYFWGRYTTVVPQSRAEHTMFYSVDAAEFAAADESGPSHVIVLDFEARDAGSWVRFSQFGEMPPEMAEGARQGMESYLDSLQTHLDANPS
jgi:uncharacterized protein YndB with AHSA1/START domain